MEEGDLALSCPLSHWVEVDEVLICVDVVMDTEDGKIPRTHVPFVGVLIMMMELSDYKAHMAKSGAVMGKSHSHCGMHDSHSALHNLLMEAFESKMDGMT